MKFLRIVLFVQCFLAYTGLFAQQTITGQVTDANGKPIDYVNIGFPGKVCGTVSDASGLFRLELTPAIGAQDSLVFSHIGYQRTGLTLADWKKHTGALQLNEVQVELNNVTVHAGLTAHEKTVGYFSDSRKSKLSMRTTVPGAELGSVIDFGTHLCKMQSLRFYIIGASTDTLLFRINVYPLKDGEPGPNRCPRNILVQVPATQHLCTVDLSAYDIYVKGVQVVAVEWIRSTTDAGTIDFSATLKTYMRYHAASQSDWQTYDKASPAFEVNVLEYR